MQLLCNTGAKFVTPVQITNGLWLAQKQQKPNESQSDESCWQNKQEQNGGHCRKVWREQKDFFIQAKFSRINENNRYISQIIIKFLYNAYSDWLKERVYQSTELGQLKNGEPICASTFWLIWHKLNVLYGSDKRKEKEQPVRNLQVMLSFRQTADESSEINKDLSTCRPLQ